MPDVAAEAAAAAHEAAEAEAAAAAHARKVSPRGDFIQSIGWIALGIATTIVSWRMDRLEKQDINPYTAPGLLPGFLGVAIVLFGALMLYRSWRRDALGPQPVRLATDAASAETRRMWTVLALCIAFAAGLVGRGIPFWAAAAIFVTVTVTLLQFAERGARNERQRGILVALVIGISAGILITLVFQEFFLVRLP